MRVVGFFFWLLIAVSACSTGGRTVPPKEGYEEAVSLLRDFISHEMDDKGLPAFSIALVDDGETVWAEGFGYEDADSTRPASASTVYRVGSVSKLFTDIAVMQLVELDSLDIDAPVSDVLENWRPNNQFGRAITLRQLMSHRAGLIREPPVGHYFDDSEPTLARTVESLNGIPLVYSPTERIKYSNAGIAVVGYAVETVRGRPFEETVSETVLEPLGMDRSAFRPESHFAADVPDAFMWTYDGRVFKAPDFQLGMGPAGSLYAPVTDLALFLQALFDGGMGVRGRVLESATLDSMLAPQFAASGATTGFGLGFGISNLDGERVVGHNGAIYGFATDLSALPDRKLGVVAATTMDGANTVVSRINRYALRLMVALQDGDPLPEAQTTGPVSADVANRMAGTYGLRENRVDLTTVGDEFFAELPRRRVRVRQDDQGLITDGKLGFGTRIGIIENGIVVAGDTLRRVEAIDPPPPSPERWNGLIGEYGWPFNTLYVMERNGRLEFLIEWFYVDPLREMAPDSFAFPEQGGLYQNEFAVFRRDEAGMVFAVDVGGVRFPRRDVGTEAGVTFTIEPVESVEILRERALAASPPEEHGLKTPDLVELRSLDSTILYDIRYATTNNFMQAVFYDSQHAFMQRPAALALGRVHNALRPYGLGLMIHDAYRPWYVTKMFWDATPQDQKIFVANPANGSRHNRGAAVDLTLYDIETGEVIEMVGGYDEFSDRSFPAYWGGTSKQRWYRGLLRRMMEQEGFQVYEFEWWHFDYRDWGEYPILNLTFDEIN